jgi:HNH endonuclease
MKKDISQECLREMLSYELASGLFRWRVKASKNTSIGAVAGTHSQGRIVIRIKSQQYLAHRLAWKYVTGEWPNNNIDHRDGDSTNNAFSNLRDVPQSVNLQNLRTAKKTNLCGLLGVRPHRSRFQAGITVAGKWHYLGAFDDKHSAHAAYLDAKRRLHTGCTI